MNPRTPRIAVAAALAAALAAGCATPQKMEALEQARATYAEVQNNPHVTRFAPKELSEAGAALNRAETMAQNERDEARVAHQAYLAERAAQIARETAMARAARAEIARADQERERVVLEARAKREQAERQRAEARLEALQAEQQRRRAAERDTRADLRQEVEKLQAEIADLETRQTDRGLVLALSGDVLFDTGKATLKPGAERGIGELARLLRERPQLAITVEGYTDSTGSEALNRELSSDRAHAVRWALVERGVNPKQVRARGMGEAFPVATNDTAAGRQLNRRVEILVPQEDAQAAVGGR